MDKRILFLIIGFQLTALGIFIYNKCAANTKNIAVVYAITPEAKLGDSIVFSDNTEGSQMRKWDFGDGEYSDRQTGTHFYMDSGHYHIKLTVYGSFGTKTDATKEIVVSAASPSINTLPTPEESIINGPNNISVGSSANYECTIKAASYSWEILDDPSYKTQQGALATYSFHSPGKRVLILRLHNPDKVSHKDIMVAATVNKPSPVPATHTHVQRPHSGNLPDLPTMKAEEIK